jgi:hypothetical protein
MGLLVAGRYQGLRHPLLCPECASCLPILTFKRRTRRVSGYLRVHLRVDLDSFFIPFFLSQKTSSLPATTPSSQTKTSSRPAMASSSIHSHPTIPLILCQSHPTFLYLFVVETVLTRSRSNWSSFRKHMAMFTISWLAFWGYTAVTALVRNTIPVCLCYCALLTSESRLDPCHFR